jgi:hypothetical protein
MPRESVAFAATPEEERDVHEVRCSVSGMPIPAIPLWYADVRVRFVSDAARTRSGAMRLAEVIEEEADEEETEEPDAELSLEDASDELVVDDIELDLDETIEAESEEEPEEVVAAV